MVDTKSTANVTIIIGIIMDLEGRLVKYTDETYFLNRVKEGIGTVGY